MKSTTKRLASLGVIAGLFLAAPGLAAAQSTNIKGMITSRTGEQLVVTAADGTKTKVTLTDTTQAKAVAGGLGLRKDAEPLNDLITGLPVSVDGVQNGAEFDATTIEFKSSDLKTAQQVQAGTAQEDAQLAAASAANKALIAQNAAKEAELKKRMSEINQYDTKASVTVHFAVNSTMLSKQSKADLQALATQAAGIKGYLISVKGYTDASGNAALNQRLSDERAARVTEYLQENCNVKPYRVLAPDAMGESHPEGSNEDAAGMAENRRVVVNVMVSKGLEGM